MKQFLNFSTKYYFLRLFKIISVKNYFPLESPIGIAFRSWLKIVALVKMLFTTEKR